MSSFMRWAAHQNDSLAFPHEALALTSSGVRKPLLRCRKPDLSPASGPQEA
jgi:hypothetical protein